MQEAAHNAPDGNEKKALEQTNLFAPEIVRAVAGELEQRLIGLPQVAEDGQTVIQVSQTANGLAFQIEALYTDPNNSQFKHFVPPPLLQAALELLSRKFPDRTELPIEKQLVSPATVIKELLKKVPPTQVAAKHQLAIAPVTESFFSAQEYTNLFVEEPQGRVGLATLTQFLENTFVQDVVDSTLGPTRSPKRTSLELDAYLGSRQLFNDLLERCFIFKVKQEISPTRQEVLLALNSFIWRQPPSLEHEKNLQIRRNWDQLWHNVQGQARELMIQLSLMSDEQWLKVLNSANDSMLSRGYGHAMKGSYYKELQETGALPVKPPEVKGAAPVASPKTEAEPRPKETRRQEIKRSFPRLQHVFLLLSALFVGVMVPTVMKDLPPAPRPRSTDVAAHTNDPAPETIMVPTQGAPETHIPPEVPASELEWPGGLTLSEWIKSDQGPYAEYAPANWDSNKVWFFETFLKETEVMPTTADSAVVFEAAYAFWVRAFPEDTMNVGEHTALGKQVVAGRQEGPNGIEYPRTLAIIRSWLEACRYDHENNTTARRGAFMETYGRS